MVHLCSISDTEADPLFDPSTSSDFLVPGWTEPTQYMPELLSIRIYVGTEYRQFNRLVESKSYEDELVADGRSTASMTVRDTNLSGSLMPFNGGPVRNQRVWVQDYTEIETIFQGFISNVDPQLVGYRPDGSAKCLFHIEMQDMWYLLEQDTYSHNYVGKRAGFILKDAVDRAGMDSSMIDPSVGPLLDPFSANEEFPASVVERVKALADWTVWLDRSAYPPKVMYGAKDIELNQVPIVINEKTWTYIFDRNLDLREDMDGFATKIVLECRQKWVKGMAAFEQGSNVVLGDTGEEDWYLQDVKQNLEIENTNTGAVYQLSKNNSDTVGANELIISENYRELDEVAPYAIRGGVLKLSRKNATAIEKLKRLRGGSGILTKVIRDDGAYTYSEASRILEAELNIATREYHRGSAKSDTRRLGVKNLSPGQTFFINLDRSKRIVTHVVIQSIRRKSTGERRVFPDGRICVKLSLDFNFTPSIYSDREQLRAIQRSERKIQATDPDKILLTEFFDNRLAIKTCAFLRRPVSVTSIGEITTDLIDTPVTYSSNGYYTDKAFTARPGGYYAFTS